MEESGAALTGMAEGNFGLVDEDVDCSKFEVRCSMFDVRIPSDCSSEPDLPNGLSAPATSFTPYQRDFLRDRQNFFETPSTFTNTSLSLLICVSKKNFGLWMLDFERGASVSELGQPGAALTGMAPQSGAIEESFAPMTCSDRSHRGGERQHARHLRRGNRASSAGQPQDS